MLRLLEDKKDNVTWHKGPRIAVSVTNTTFLWSFSSLFHHKKETNKCLCLSLTLLLLYGDFAGFRSDICDSNAKLAPGFARGREFGGSEIDDGASIYAFVKI